MNFENHNNVAVGGHSQPTKIPHAEIHREAEKHTRGGEDWESHMWVVDKGTRQDKEMQKERGAELVVT